MRSRQSGVALLGVLLVMSVALLLTASLLRGHRLYIKSAGQQLDYLVLRDAALAGEVYALEQLRPLEGGRRSRVSLGQAWAREGLELQLDKLQVRVKIEDRAGRLNLDALLREPVPAPLLVERWSNLLAVLNVPALDLRTASRQRWADLSELRHLPGVDSGVLARLAPYVGLLPRDASLNVNTATAPIFSALGMSMSVAQALVAQRPAQGYASLDEFLSQPLLDGSIVGAQGLGLTSRWFEVHTDVIDVQSGDRRLRLISDVQLRAAGQRPAVVQRRLVASSEKEEKP